jgi:hypothetical protein
MGSRNPERDSPVCRDDMPLEAWITDNPGWVIFLTCRDCINGSYVQPQRLLRLRTPPRTWGEMKARLACGKCRSKEFSLTLRYAGRRRD